MNLALPPGYYLPPAECPRCGTRGTEVDTIEGLPIFRCQRPDCDLAAAIAQAERDRLVVAGPVAHFGITGGHPAPPTAPPGGRPVCPCGGPLRILRDKHQCLWCGAMIGVCCEGGRTGP